MACSGSRQQKKFFKGGIMKKHWSETGDQRKARRAREKQKKLIAQGKIKPPNGGLPKGGCVNAQKK